VCEEVVNARRKVPERCCSCSTPINVSAGRDSGETPKGEGGEGEGKGGKAPPGGGLYTKSYAASDSAVGSSVTVCSRLGVHLCFVVVVGRPHMPSTHPCISVHLCCISGCVICLLAEGCGRCMLRAVVPPGCVHMLMLGAACLNII
jgi:hypothetical protein